MAQKYDAPPSNIDFASARETVRDTSLIDALEKMYASYTPPPEVSGWPAEDRAEKETQIEEAKATVAFTEEMIKETEREIVFMESNRSTRDTSAEMLGEIYPDIAEEIQDEIERREWFKDTVNK